MNGEEFVKLCYKEKETLLNKCGKIEEHAFTYFMER